MPDGAGSRPADRVVGLQCPCGWRGRPVGHCGACGLPLDAAVDVPGRAEGVFRALQDAVPGSADVFELDDLLGLVAELVPGADPEAVGEAIAELTGAEVRDATRWLAWAGRWTPPRSPVVAQACDGCGGALPALGDRTYVCDGEGPVVAVLCVSCGRDLPDVDDPPGCSGYDPEGRPVVLASVSSLLREMLGGAWSDAADVALGALTDGELRDVEGWASRALTSHEELRRVPECLWPVLRALHWSREPAPGRGRAAAEPQREGLRQESVWLAVLAERPSIEEPRRVLDLDALRELDQAVVGAERSGDWRPVRRALIRRMAQCLAWLERLDAYASPSEVRR